MASIGGNRVGAWMLDKMWWAKRPDGFFGSVRVDPDLWNQGIGAELYDLLLARATELEAGRIYSDVREDRPNCRAFAEKRGFKESGHSNRQSRLLIESVSLTGYEGLEDRLRSEGIEVKTLLEVSGRSDPALKANELGIDRISPQVARGAG